MVLLQEHRDVIPVQMGFEDPVYDSQIVFRKIIL